MATDKYPLLANRKAAVVGIDVARTASAARSPLVATAERGRITLYWWLPAPPGGASGWASFERTHAPMYLPPDGGMATLLSVPWSQRVAVSSGPDCAFLCYKRALAAGSAARLYVETLAWDSSARAIESREGPVEVPLSGLGFEPEPGFSLWMRYVPTFRRIVILVQAMRIVRARFGPRIVRQPCLALLTASPGDDLSRKESWNATVVDRGGYDLDACVAGQSLFLAFRQQADALVMDLNPPAPGDIRDVGVVAEQHAIVSVWRVEPERGTHTRLPDLRGEHLRFQHLDPLLMTIERTTHGRVFLGAAGERFEGEVRFQATGRETALCRLFQSTGGNAWDSGRLLEYDARVVPRNVIRDASSEGDGAHYAFRQVPGTPDRPHVRYSTAESLMPMPLVRYELIEDKGLEIVDFLHHWSPYESLLDSRFELRVPTAHPAGPEGALQPVQLDVQWRHYRVIDINHSECEFVRPSPPLPSENLQFFPVHFNSDVPDRQSYRAESTIGGCLAADPMTSGPELFAYTDLGDEGLRVVVDGNVDPADPGPQPDEKAMDPDAVPGPGQPDEQWIEISHGEGDWLGGSLVGRPTSARFPDGGPVLWTETPTLGSATEATLGFLFNLLDTWLNEPLIQDLRAIDPPDALELTPANTAALACAFVLWTDPACGQPTMPTRSHGRTRFGPRWPIRFNPCRTSAGSFEPATSGSAWPDTPWISPSGRRAGADSDSTA